MLVYIWVKIGQEPPNKNCIRVVGFWKTSFQMKLHLIFVAAGMVQAHCKQTEPQRGNNEHRPLCESPFNTDIYAEC